MLKFQLLDIGVKDFWQRKLFTLIQQFEVHTEDTIENRFRVHSKSVSLKAPHHFHIQKRWTAISRVDKMVL